MPYTRFDNNSKKCGSQEEKYYGFKGNLLITEDGIILGITVTAANIDERVSMFDIIDDVKNYLFADMGFLSKDLKDHLMECKGINLQTPKRKNMHETRNPNFLKKIKNTRRLIETVIGQLQEQFNISKIRARNLWHLTNRITRKILSHTISALINLDLGQKPVQLSALIT